MKKTFIQGTSVLLSAFLLVGCSDGACCEDGVEVLSTLQPNGEERTQEIKKVLVEENSTNEFIIPNLAPKAVAYANDSLEMIKVCACESVQFDASSSYDPDGDDTNLSYLWSDKNDFIINDQSSFEQQYDHQGVYEMTLTVRDDHNATSVDRVCVLVNIDEEYIPLNVHIGGDRNVKAGEKISLFGRAICRNDDLNYAWSVADKLLSTEAVFEHSFEVGEHILTLTIEDSEGNSATDSVVINSI